MKCERMHWVATLVLSVTVTAMCGCGSDKATPSSTTVTSTPSAPPTDAPAVPDMSAALSGKKDPQRDAPAGQTTDEQVAGHGAELGAPEEVQEERQVAVAGVGKKGSRYGGGFVSQPVSSYFGARERITFISVQKAMRTFQALHDRLPNSHEEFMSEIVKENGLTLPGLFEGERYEYDPEAGELMVVKPKKN